MCMRIHRFHGMIWCVVLSFKYRPWSADKVCDKFDKYYVIFDLQSWGVHFAVPSKTAWFQQILSIALSSVRIATTKFDCVIDANFFKLLLFATESPLLSSLWNTHHVEEGSDPLIQSSPSSMFSLVASVPPAGLFCPRESIRHLKRGENCYLERVEWIRWFRRKEPHRGAENESVTNPMPHVDTLKWTRDIQPSGKNDRRI